MRKINLKKFTIEELQKISVDLNIECKGLKNDQFLTISDNITYDVLKGSENLYLSIVVYGFDPKYKKYILNIWTKEAHETLKMFLIKLIVNI